MPIKPNTSNDPPDQFFQQKAGKLESGPLGLFRVVQSRSGTQNPACYPCHGSRNDRPNLEGRGVFGLTLKTLQSAIEPALTTRLGVLFQTNCLNLFAQIKDDSVDSIFADPPFNLKKAYGNGSFRDDLRDGDYLEWSYRWLDESIRILKPGGAIFIYILPRWGYRLAGHLEDQGMVFRHWIALTMKGTYPRGKKLYPAHYALLYFTKGEPRTFNKLRLPIPTCRHCGGDLKDYGGHRKYLNPEGLNLTDFWEDTSPARHGKFKARWHINELKPMIPERCIQISTNPREIVLDPFGGGGSTYQAAQENKRFWIGSEINDCTPILERLQGCFPEEIGQEPAKQLLSVFR